MLQLPLINQAVSTVQPKEYPAAISLTNMMRQLGGAFGIALANNYAVTRAAQHRGDLMTNMSTDNPIFVERLNNIVRNLSSTSGDMINATAMAYKQLELTVVKQAYFLAYLDTFRLISIFFIVVFPLVFLMKNKKMSAEEAAKAAKIVAESH
jgi:DHA2 family multidrug resistance protein